MGRMSPGVRAGIEGSSRSWVGMLEIFSAFAELDKVDEFIGCESSDCIGGSGILGRLAGLDELCGVADIASSGERTV
jgi:hypothetical protein